MSASRSRIAPRGRAMAFIAGLGVLLSVALAAPATAASGAADAAASVSAPARALALSGSSFNAGYIIDDANFYQRKAMTQTQIQEFLKSKVTCSNSNCLASLKAKTEKRDNDRNICLGYTPDADARESAAAIIYKVQQSCGISARVLLVTLQKEQGLITKAAPTTGELNAAMGYRCPDTAPCANQAAGFFRQIYGAAWQFRRYSFPDKWGNYQIGSNSIAYSTSSSCGRKTVNIRNNATAALYNYTPYTPNAAALSNLRGTAPCGSYGNRNFWVFYNDWFGSPLAGAGEGAITAVYEDAGGASGALGALTSTAVCGPKATTCKKTYENGMIVWTASHGAYTITGDVLPLYLAKSSMMGTPTTEPVPVDAGADGAGFRQGFTSALVSSSPAGTFLLTGLNRSKVSKLGGLTEGIGWPTGEKTCKLAKKACVQPFQHGALVSASTSAAVFVVMQPSIFEYWEAAGGAAGALGVARADASTVSAPTGDGTTQTFVGGYIASSDNGTYVVKGALRTAYSKRQTVRGVLGWPTSDRTCGFPGGVCSQTFEGGTLYASSKAAGMITNADIAEYYDAKGGPSGALGIPAYGMVARNGKNGPGVTQTFSKAMILSSESGTFAMIGKMRTAHSKQGGVNGKLGWPVADQVCGLPNKGCSQEFQHGTITHDSKGVRVQLH